MNSRLRLVPLLVCQVFVGIVSLTCTAPVKTKLNNVDLIWIDPYRDGDTLIFRSDDAELDTTFIIKKHLFYPEYMPIEVHDKYLPHTAIVTYANRKMLKADEIVSLRKRQPDGETILTISYLFSVFVANIEEPGTLPSKDGDLYLFDTYNPIAKPWSPMKLYWSEKRGIVKYTSHDSTTWTLLEVRPR